jgi:FHA domain
VIVCHVCGTNNPDGTKFCEGCGVELQASSTPVAAAVPVEAAVVAAAPVAEVAAAAVAPAVTVQETLQGQLSASDVLADPNAPVMTPAITTDPVPTAAPADASVPASSATPPVDAVSSPNATGSGDASTGPVVSPEVVPDVPSSTEIDASVAAAAAAIVPQTAVIPGTAPANARLLPRQFGALGNNAFPLNGARLSVGRFDPSTGPVDIDLSGMPGESHVSRRHGEMYLENGKWMVRDLGSTNGIYVKHAADASFGPRLQSPQALVSGDEIAFGNVMFVYQDDSGGATA